MEVVRLTNLGNLTLQHLLTLEDRYSENARLKREKLTELWGSEHIMTSFQSLFNTYRGGATDWVMAREGGEVLYRSIDGYADIAIDPALRTLFDRFQEMGLVAIRPDARRLVEIAEDIQICSDTNPARNIEHVVVELTGLCNLRCRHCFRGGSRQDEYGLPVEVIIKALRPLLRAGILDVTITGGEPTLRMNDMFDVLDFASRYLVLRGCDPEERRIYRFGKPNPTVDDLLALPEYVGMRQELMQQLEMPEEELKPGDWKICDQNTPDDVEQFMRDTAAYDLRSVRKPKRTGLDAMTVLTNGYFPDQRRMVRRLKAYGRVFLETSLDSYDPAITDQNRGRQGAFAHVESLVKAGYHERWKVGVMAHNLGSASSKVQERYRGYFERQAHVLDMSGMMMLGNAASGRFPLRSSFRDHVRLGELRDDLGDQGRWCSDYIGPDTLHLQPSGSVINCQFASAVPEGYGNVQTQSMEDIVNTMQDSRIVRMFLDGSIERYQHELDWRVFGKEYSHQCEPTVLTVTYVLIKERLMRDGADDPVEMANREVARRWGFGPVKN